MTTSRCFEELRVWQTARVLVKNIYGITSDLKDYAFNDQIRRAAISVMNNIAEGFEGGSDSMFKKYLLIAKGSCGEVRSMIYLAEDLGYIDTERLNNLLTDCKELSKGISKLATYLDRTNESSQ